MKIIKGKILPENNNILNIIEFTYSKDLFDRTKKQIQSIKTNEFHKEFLLQTTNTTNIQIVDNKTIELYYDEKLVYRIIETKTKLFKESFVVDVSYYSDIQDGNLEYKIERLLNGLNKTELINPTVEITTQTQ